eukprot:Opistho-2@96234
MALKSIIVNIHEVEELVTFPSDIDTEDLVELFRSAALANTSDVLQLRAANSRAIVPITCDLAENDRSSPYVLTVVQAPKQVEGGRTRKVSAFYQQRMEELRSMSRSNLNAPYGSRGNLVPPSDDESDCEGADSMPPRLPLNTNMGPAPAVAPAIAHRQPAARRDSITSFGLSFAPGRKTSMAIGGRMTQPGRSNEKAIGMDLPSSVTSRLRKNSVFAEEGSRKARLLSDVRHVTKEHLETLQAEARRVREVELAELRPRFLIAHDSRFAQVWTTTYLTAMVIDAFVIPFAIAFPEGNDGVPIGLLITYIMDLVLIADIFLRFQWEYMDGERRVDTAREISRHYRKKQFRWDVFGVFPFDFIALGYGGVYLLPLLRLNRLVNLPKIFRHFKAEENDIKRETGMIRVRMYIIGGFLIMHVLACIWHLISCYPTIDGNLTHCRRNGWVSASDGQIGDSKFSAYISSLYWTVCSMTSVGYGDILAQNDYERIYACIVMILGVCLFSFVMGNVASAVASADAMRDEFRQKVRTVRQYMAYHDIRADLQMAIDDYYANEWNIKHGVDTSFYNSLPEAFRAEIALEINRKQLVKVPVFLDCNEDILKELALRMRPTSILANKFILRRGEESHDMFFLMEGLVRVISEDDGTVYAELGKGNFFGEVGVLFDLPRTATVITASHCDMFLLGKEDMLDVVARFEPLKDKLNQCAGERLMWFKKHRYVDTGNDFGGNLEMEMNLENLRKVDLFRDCGDEELLRELSAAMETIMYEPGDLIIKKGTIGHEMFFIKCVFVSPFRHFLRCCLCASVAPLCSWRDCADVLPVCQTVTPTLL